VERPARPLKAAGSTDLKFMSCSMVPCLEMIIWWMIPENPIIAARPCVTSASSYLARLAGEERERGSKPRLPGWRLGLANMSVAVSWNLPHTKHHTRTPIRQKRRAPNSSRRTTRPPYRYLDTTKALCHPRKQHTPLPARTATRPSIQERWPLPGCPPPPHTHHASSKSEEARTHARTQASKHSSTSAFAPRDRAGHKHHERCVTACVGVGCLRALVD
jgi:hypothetical protein